MLKHKGGDKVKAGIYWHVREWAAEVVPPEGAALPGDETAAYVRLPLPALLVLAPAMGAVFAIFLPFIGLAMLATFLTGRMKRSHTPPAVETEDHRRHVA